MPFICLSGEGGYDPGTTTETARAWMWDFQMQAKDALTIWERDPCLRQPRPRYFFSRAASSAPVSWWAPFPIGGWEWGR